MSGGHYTVKLDHERRLVHVVAEGEFDKDLGEELITNARQDAVGQGYNISVMSAGHH
jgi:hypothetical protein